MKVPYMIVVGDREVESSSVSVRSLSGRDERDIDPAVFLDDLIQEIAQKRGAAV